MTDDIVIAGAARTPIGGFQGALSGLPATALGAHALRAALQDAGGKADQVSEVLMGCVLPAGLGQAPARQAAIGADLGQDVPATTINKVCGSGMKAVMLGVDQLRLGAPAPILAGGMENMSQAPYLATKMRAGARLGHAELKDHMFLDGLEDAYEPGRLMGSFAELCAAEYQFTRTAQDDYALSSLERAKHATARGDFAAEIAPVASDRREKGREVSEDEQPQTARPEKIPTLRPAFKPDGTVTAANASSISDGAAALLLANRGQVDQLGLRVRARVVGHATHAQAPEWFTTAPVHATRTLLKRLDWQVSEVDLWEVNEAFAVVAMAFIQDFGLDREIVNINGGACALGHPIGASGARILVTLVHALEAQDLRRGVAAICLGGGEATAVAVERI